MKLSWILIAVLVFLLFRNQIGATVDRFTSTTPARPPGYDYFGAALPAPGYYNQPPAQSPAPSSGPLGFISDLLHVGERAYETYTYGS